MEWPEAAEHLARPSVGVTDSGKSLKACIWAPHHESVTVEFLDGQRCSLQPTGSGYFEGELDRSLIGQSYWLVLGDGLRRADPASRYQPEGVHGPSQAIALDFPWSDSAWRGHALRDLIIYELHVGTFSRDGSFAAIERQLDQLVDLGITAIELMPIAQFPGKRNWGYDGVFPFAAQNSYGNPASLCRLVDSCHHRGLAVILDVVYNHLGPEGNYLADFGPYFTDRYHTPWGDALNFDGHHSDGVRRFFIDNAVSWIRDYHFDGLRLDAIQMIFDNSARPFLGELAATIHQLSEQLQRPIYLWGETNQNDVRQLRPSSENGIGLDGVWNDDFHHALHAKLTGERVSVYADHGSTANIAKALTNGFVLDGAYSHHHRRRHGSDSRAIRPDRFVVFSQNHDQIGNRLYGDRLTQLVTIDQLKLAAACTLLSANVPMLYMGEEHGETNPFLYFVDHEDAGLRRAVRRGRTRDFHAYRQPGRAIPDPSRIATFHQSRLTPNQNWTETQRAMFEYYQQLIHVRRNFVQPPKGEQLGGTVVHDMTHDVIYLKYDHHDTQTLIALNFASERVEILPECSAGTWKLILDSKSFAAAEESELEQSWVKEADRASAPLIMAACQVAVWTRTRD